MPQLPRWITHVVPPVLLAAAVCLLHGNAVSGFWRFDDPQMLDFARHQPLIESFFRPDVWQKLGAPFFTPLLTFSYAIDDALFDLIPSGFYLHHLASLFLAAWMTTRLLRRWTPSVQATLGGILFLTGFPVTVVAQQLMTRHYIEGLVFAIAALICFHDASHRPGRAWTGALCYLLAMLAKEVYAPLILFLFVATDWRTSGPPRLRRLAPYLLAAAAYLPWRQAMLGGVGGYTTRLIPDSAELLDFLRGSLVWTLGDGHGTFTVALALLTTGVLLCGIRTRALRPATLTVAALLLAAPLLPVMISSTQAEAPAYFIPHRYLFLPWWALSCALALALSPPRRTMAAPLSSTSMTLRPSTAGVAIAFAAAFAGAMTYNQTPAADCFRHLITDNEQLYRTAWRDNDTAVIQVPRTLIPYVSFMTRHIASLRSQPVERMPRIAEAGRPQAPPPAEAVTAFTWSYNPKTRAPRRPR